jgi:hypothetical protein
MMNERVFPGDAAVLGAFRATLDRYGADTVVLQRDGFSTVEACVNYLQKNWTELADITRTPIRQQVERVLMRQFTAEELAEWRKVLALPPPTPLWTPRRTEHEEKTEQ